MHDDPQAWFHTLATHYVEAQIYFHLNQAGVIARLNGGPASVADLAGALDLDRRILGVLLEYVSEVGPLIERTGADQFRFTDFGRSFLARYGKHNGDQLRFNVFDVRVGAWGPLWPNLGGLLDRSVQYGTDLHRAGEYAADGLFKLAAPLAGAIRAAADRLGAEVLVEIGPTSGILAQLSEPGVPWARVGVDRKSQSLELAATLAMERGVSDITWSSGDLFEPQAWLSELPRDRPTLFFSCHFHEFLARGRDPVVQAVSALAAHPHTVGVVALEHPRLDPDQRDAVSATRWLYSSSNVLIHHLIRNAKILTAKQWRAVFDDAGCAPIREESTDCFAFTSFVGEVGAR